MQDLKDVCPVCSAQNKDLLADMCDECNNEMNVKTAIEINNNMFKSIDRYLFHK